MLQTQKFGIRVTKTVEEAIAIDKESGTNHWKEEINLKAKSVDGAFQELEEGKDVPAGYQFV
jgi:hypothetical protein